MKSEVSKPLKAYVYGMTLLSTLHQLKEGYPKEDTYGEISRTSVVPGGEAANGAILLSHWGIQSVLDGTYLGTGTRLPLLAAFEKFGVDCSLMSYDGSFEGWKDLVLCGGGSRTVLGWFQTLFAAEQRRWNEVNSDAVAESDVVTVDPFFGASSLRVAEACVAQGTPFVSIDSRYDSLLAQKAAAIVLSGEFLDREFGDIERSELLGFYGARCEGLVVFTSGSGKIEYMFAGRKRSLDPYPVEVVDTLAAGDSFRAGVAYGIVNGMEADRVVRYGAAVAALVCGRFPSIHPVPDLREVEALVNVR